MPESVNVAIALPEEGFDAVIHLCLPASVGQKMRTLRGNGYPSNRLDRPKYSRRVVQRFTVRITGEGTV